MTKTCHKLYDCACTVRAAFARQILLLAGLLIIGQHSYSASISGSGTTFTVTLDAADELIIQQAGTSYTFTLQPGGTWSGTVAGTTVADNILTITSTARSAYNLFRILDNGAGVILKFGEMSTTSSYDDSFEVSLDDGAALTAFEGNNYFTGDNSISVITDAYIRVVDGELKTVNGNITLSANMQATPRTFGEPGISNTGKVEVTGSGLLVVKGKGGSSFYSGISSSANSLIIGGTTGTTTIEGIGIVTVATTGDVVGILLGGEIGSNGSHVNVQGYVVATATGSTGRLQGINIGTQARIYAGGSGDVTIVGTGGPGGNFSFGVQADWGSITSNGGNISITGTGVGSGSSSNCQGIAILSGTQISAGGSGTVTLNGTGGVGTAGQNHGVWVKNANTSITTAGGNISITGTGGGTGTAGYNYGVSVDMAGQIIAGGGGTLMINGTGGAGSGDANYGVYVDGSSTLISSSGGNVNITGLAGGSGISATNYGIIVSAAGQIIAGGSGILNIQGTGGSGSGNTNHGVHVTGSSSLISSSGGNVTVNGIAGGSAGSGTNYGVSVSNGGRINVGGSGTMTITGTGGTGSGNGNYGVYVAVSSSSITSSDGNISITGNAGGSGTSINNFGVHVSAGLISAGGTGTMTIVGNGGNRSGTGASGASNNHGVYLSAVGRITTNNGNNSVTGNGGGPTGSVASAATLNMGVFLESGSYINAGGSGTTTVTGEGGANSTGSTGGSNYGVYVNGQSSYISASNGAVSVTGNGGGDGGTGTNNHGVFLLYASGGASAEGNIKSGSSSAAVTVNGTGGTSSGNENVGVRIDGLATIISSGGGAVSVTGNGGGTGSSTNNYGVLMQNSAIVRAGGSADVTVTGIAGSTNGGGCHGVYMLSGGTITSNASTGGNVTVSGTAGTGTGNTNHGVFITGTNTKITSGAGNVSVTGIGGGSGTAATNHGVSVEAGGQINAGNPGTVTVTGTGGTGSGNTNYGVQVNATASSITSGGGNVTVTGTAGGTGTSITNYGVYITAGTISATGSGNLSIVGNGGNRTGAGATNANNHGVYLASVGKITSAGGNVAVTGYGGGAGGSVSSAANLNMGVYLAGGSYILAGGNGSTTVIGEGGANSTGGTGGSNYGVYVNGVASYISAANGEVNVTGNGGGDGGSGTSNHGVYIVFATGTSANGNIKSGSTSSAVNVTGTGGTSSGNDNYGVRIQGNTSAMITTGGGNLTINGTGGGIGASLNNFGVSVSAGTITAASSGTVTVNGNGGNLTGGGAANANNHGLYLLSSAKIISAGGNVSVTGNGGGPSGTVSGAANFNHGICMLSGTYIAAGGTGSTTVNGKGGANSTNATGGDNYGIFLITGATSTATTAAGTRPYIGATNGTVSVTGSGGGDGGTGDKNYGIYLYLGGYITSATTGQSVTVNGTGGTGSSGNNYGIYMKGGTSTTNVSSITSGGGAVSISGTGGSVGSVGQTGILMQAYATITSGTGGAVNITATAGASTGSNISRGLVMETATALISSGGGDVSITATEGSTDNSVAISIDAAKIDLGTNGGNLTINANSIKWVTNGLFNVKSSNTMTVAPRTAGKQINLLSAATDPYEGPLELLQTRLRLMTGGTVRLGDANTGTTTISSTMDISTTTQNIVLTTASSGAGVSPTATGSDFVMGTSKTLTLSAPLNIQINGTTVNNESTGYRRFTVTGTTSTLALSSASLVLTGSYTPATGDVFTIVTATGLTGTFDGLAEDATLTFNGKTLRVNYTATSVTLTCIANFYTWNGSVSSSWTDPNNWTPNVVPSSTDEVVIPVVSSPAVPPQLSTNTTANHLSIAAGSTLVVPATTTLTVSGNLTVDGASSGDGTISMAGTSAQTIAGAGTVKNLTVNNSSGVTITDGAGNELKVTGTLTPSTGVLTTNGNLRLRSTAIQTARIDQHANTGSISGAVIVERYLEGSSRINQWRLLGFPYSTSVALSSISGMSIDVTTNKSVMIFNESGDDAASTGRNAGYQSFSNLSDVIAPGQGFSAWVYGNSGGAASSGSLAAPLTIESSGSLNESGNPVSIPVSYTTGKGWNLVANPFASSIDWSVVVATASNITNVGATVYRWNPATQAWASHNGTTGTGMDNIIESGAGFFVRTTAASPSLTIPQSAKVATNANSTNLFRAAPFLLDIPGESIRKVKTKNLGIRMWAAGMGNPAPDEIYLDLSREDATAGFDNRYDAHSMGRTAGAGLSITDSTGLQFAMQFDAPIRDAGKEKRYYPLTVTTPVPGMTKITLSREGNWDAANTISLIDLAEHRTMVMTGDTLQYDFRMDAKKISGRFMVAVNHIPASPLNDINVRTLGNPVTKPEIDMIITHPTAKPRRWIVTSISGARIGEGMFQQMDGNVQHHISVPRMHQNGLYQLIVEMDNGERKTVHIIRQ